MDHAPDGAQVADIANPEHALPIRSADETCTFSFAGSAAKSKRPSSRSKCRMPAQKPRQVMSLASARPATKASASEATAVKGLIGQPILPSGIGGLRVFVMHQAL